jgi:hypothetical protein
MKLSVHVKLHVFFYPYEYYDRINYTNNLLINPIHFENRTNKAEITILSEFK